MRFLTSFLISVVFLSLFATSAVAHIEPQLDTRTFVGIVRRAALFEISTAKLALQKSASPNIRAYATRTLGEQRVALDELNHLSTKSGLQVGDTLAIAGGVAPWLDADKFDRAYSKRRVAERKKLVILLHKGLSSSDANVREYAQRMLPMCLEQLYRAQQLRAAN